MARMNYWKANKFARERRLLEREGLDTDKLGMPPGTQPAYVQKTASGAPRTPRPKRNRWRRN